MQRLEVLRRDRDMRVHGLENEEVILYLSIKASSASLHSKWVRHSPMSGALTRRAFCGVSLNRSDLSTPPWMDCRCLRAGPRAPWSAGVITHSPVTTENNRWHTPQESGADVGCAVTPGGRDDLSGHCSCDLRTRLERFASPSHQMTYTPLVDDAARAPVPTENLIRAGVRDWIGSVRLMRDDRFPETVPSHTGLTI
jgi:hypothetical protein